MEAQPTFHLGLSIDREDIKIDFRDYQDEDDDIVFANPGCFPSLAGLVCKLAPR